MTYTRFAAGVIVLYLFIIFLTNTVVDPLRVSGWPWSAKVLEKYRDTSKRMRTAKAGLVKSNQDWQVALIGSSRVGDGLNPRDERWRGRNVVNLGLSGGMIYETDAMCRYAMSQCDLKEIVIAIDPGDLSFSYDSREAGDFHSSPLDPTKRNLEATLGFSFGASVFELSIETLQRAANDEKPESSQEGYRMREAKYESAEEQLAFIRKSFFDRSPSALPEPFDTPLRIDPAKRELLRGLLMFLKEKGTNVSLIYLPRHAVLYARPADGATPKVPFEHERRELCGLVAELNEAVPGASPVALWDFNNAHPLNGEILPLGNRPRMRYWNDLSHFSEIMGSAMIAKITGTEPPELPGAENYGILLTPENLNSYLAEVAAGYGRYITRDGREDLEFKELVHAEETIRR